jgi:toxin ParE1/3/4
LKVIWSDQAIANLDEIEEYISNFNPDAAQRLGQRLIELSNSLGSFPNRGRPSPYGAREMVSVRPYILRYRVIGDTVEIVQVRHMARSEDT